MFICWSFWQWEAANQSPSDAGNRFYPPIWWYGLFDCLSRKAFEYLYDLTWEPRPDPMYYDTETGGR
jgi:hypothetical protein